MVWTALNDCYTPSRELELRLRMGWIFSVKSVSYRLVRRVDRVRLERCWFVRV